MLAKRPTCIQSKNVKWKTRKKHYLDHEHVISNYFSPFCRFLMCCGFTLVNSECWRSASGHQRPPRAVNMAQSASSLVNGRTSEPDPGMEGRSCVSEMLEVRWSRPFRRRWQASKSASQMCSSAGPPQLQRNTVNNTCSDDFNYTQWHPDTFKS